MITDLTFDPLIPLSLWMGLAAVGVCAIGLSFANGLQGWAWRFLALTVLLLALLQPSVVREERNDLEDIVLVITDETRSQSIGERPVQTAEAEQRIMALLSAEPNLRIRQARVTDADDNRGTRLISEVEALLAEEPADQISGVILITDGEVHDIAPLDSLTAPLHVMLSGDKQGYDRRLIVKNAPAYAIVGETISVTLRVDELGPIPDQTGMVELSVAVDGGREQRFRLPTNEDVEVNMTLPHGGTNIFELRLAPLDGELTEQNNSVLLSINAIRDRLRVLLVSGEPHPGTRTWRNLLKSDSSVDLVHFTILRPPGKQDGVPVDELSLIAFPTRELFLEKIDDFDLIIFDRYQRRGILPASYLENIARYVEDGGAVLVSAGPDFATVNSLYRSPLGRVLPVEPTSRIISKPFVPALSEDGIRHPVSAELPSPETWGRWFQQVQVTPKSGHVLMTGAEDQPLLILDRVGQGRISLIASDHTWLWDRKFEGGGPQLELLRRLAHWMMAEPELEEEALIAEQMDATVRILRRTMGDPPNEVVIRSPSGKVSQHAFSPRQKTGGHEAIFESEEQGLFQMEAGGLQGVFAMGPASPKEFENPLSTPDILAPVVAASGGGTFWISDGIPRLRNVEPGRNAAGRNWFAITPRGAFDTLDIRKIPLAPAWLVALFSGGFLLIGWLIEGRRANVAGLGKDRP